MESKQEKSVAKGADKQKKTVVAWENPLIPNARLRQIYLAMTQARALEKVLPAAKRSRTVEAKAAATRGLEAALVSAAFDLGPSDLVVDTLTGGVVEFLRGAALSDVLQTEKSKGASRVRRAVASVCAARLSAPTGIVERIWAAMGAAAALKSANALARTAARAEAGSEADAVGNKSEDDAQGAATAWQAGVVVFYALPGEVPSSLWKKALKFAAEQDLPVVFVVLPAARVRGAAKVGGVSALAMGCAVPGIAVDADDAIAIYRVAQESIGRARAGGGAALIECVPFLLEGKGVAAKRTANADAIATLERYLLGRGIATKIWMESEAKSFAKRLAK
ncbi:MAG: thiamine pyrophosphate-dependent enzyme [Acidobacteriaceae bacterium]|nr:thiamine pyrophosphate-dependent enzyme [Acidobacteriaceae bacterium]